MSKKNTTSAETVDSPSSTRKLAILGLVLSLTISVAGLVVSVVALVKARRAGRWDPAAIAGIIVGVIGIGVFFLALWYVLQLLEGQVGPCQGLEPGTYGEGRFTYECGPA
ncbi:MAG: hypothetical protein KF761_14340 [Salinibacterium sp.]|nr:hypothetical protein [Salinibacterium sp.]